MPSLKNKHSASVVAKRKRAKVVEKLNPFEVRINKKKHDVLGQKGKSDKGLPGVARSKAVKKRKTTLLVEYQQRNKSNQFVDRRFGEYDDQLTAEEKMMKRFTLERKRKHERSGLFNLSDDEEGLTHYGQSIGDMERFDHIELSGDEMEEEDIGSTHFGGVLRKKQKLSESEELVKSEKLRSRKEIMQEVVAKSKAMKYKQQNEKQNVEELLDKINTDWKALKTSLPFAGEEGKTRPNQSDDYDKTVRELAFERRGQPTNRMKTEEELAKEEKEKLEKLEADRVRRMRGVASSSDEAITESADYVRETSALNKKKVQFAIRYKDGKIVTDGDDLGVASEESGVIDTNEAGDVSEDGGNSETDDGSEDGDESDSCDPANEYGSDLESDDDVSEQESVEEEGEKVTPSQAQIKKMKELASKELPFTFPVPKSLEELQAIVDNRSPEECLTAVERIHSCNHPSIDPGNKKKLQEFLSIFLDYCSSLGELRTRDNLETVNKMAKPLFKLCQLNPLFTAQLFQDKLQLFRQSWVQEGGNRYPPLSQLILFKLIAVVFPTSDFEHPITTPALLLMGQLLAKCTVKCMDDLVSGLFVCQWVLEYLSQSKRFMPELVNFLTSLLGYFAADGAGICFPPLSGKQSKKISLFKCKGDSIPTLLTLVVDPGASNAGYCVLRTALSAVSSLVELYSNLPSFSELVAPLITNLESAMRRSWPPAVEGLLSDTLEHVHNQGNKDKTVLQLLKQKPKSIKFYEPKFDEVYEINRKKARSKSMGERQKLKHKVKKETKGAIREIRKDTSFLAKEKLSEQRQLDAERAAKTKKILHDLEMGQHEVKQERRRKRN